jgi:hypothetical protein
MNSSAMFQLNPSIPVVTADGKGEAIGWIDYGKDDELLWIVFLQKNGECWIYPNPQIRACPNITTGRLIGISTEKLSKSIGNGLSGPDRKRKKIHFKNSFLHRLAARETDTPKTFQTTHSKNQKPW